MIPIELQPDQDPSRWDDHVSVYERVFEPFSTTFAKTAIAALGVTTGSRCLDVGCGSGAGALEMASIGGLVDAVDLSGAMIDRVKERALAAGATVNGHQMDGQALAFADDSFDARMSVFGIILFPDTVAGLRELRRVVIPGGSVAVVAWTQPQDFELAMALRTAVTMVRPDIGPQALPAQLRFRELADFRALFSAAGFERVSVTTHTAEIRAPSAKWLADRIAFAPGMSAMICGLGKDAPAVLDCFVKNLETVHDKGPVALKGTAFIGLARVT